MKLQVAIDRVPLAEAISLAKLLDENGADIIEIGTSLIKDYGLESVRQIKANIKQAQILADIKTMDEGEYEFRQFFEAGADYLTVMAAATVETIQVCYQTAQKYQKEIMIDLLGVELKKVQDLCTFEEAVFCLHTSIDTGATKDPVKDVRAFQNEFPVLKRIAIAGGITTATIAELKKAGLEIVIIGSAITKADDIPAKIQESRREMN